MSCFHKSTLAIVVLSCWKWSLQMFEASAFRLCGNSDVSVSCALDRVIVSLSIPMQDLNIILRPKILTVFSATFKC